MHHVVFVVAAVHEVNGQIVGTTAGRLLGQPLGRVRVAVGDRMMNGRQPVLVQL